MIETVKDKSFFIHLRSKIFEIPSNFPSLININQNIYHELITQRKYKIKSNVRENICQLFINYWVYGEIPKINMLNFSEYDNLSQEFEIMVNIIQLYKNHIVNKPNSQLFFTNQELKIKYESTKSKFSQTQANYHKIIEYLFDNGKFTAKSFQNSIIRSKLYQSCLKEKVEFIQLFTRPNLSQNGLIYSINEEEKTSGIIYYYGTANFTVTIPKSIIYNSEEYMVTIIHKEAFKKSNISKVQFEDDSVLKIIDDKAFTNSSLSSIKIPKHVTRLGQESFYCCLRLYHFTFSEDSELKIIEEGAFGSSKLNSIEIPPSVEVIEDCFCGGDPRVTKLQAQASGSNFFENYSDKFLLGRTDHNDINSKFDVIISYNGCYENLKIPSFIKRIAPYSFYGVEYLEKLTFFEDSKLESIGSYSFAHCSVESISIPSQVRVIEDGAFSECDNLKRVTFSEDSKLLTIGKRAFSESKIMSLSIPSSIVELKSNWCECTPCLTNIKIGPKSSNYSLLNNNIIIGKSESSGDVFDTIVFACRNIEKVVIPSFIKRIAGSAFCDCLKLKSIVFPKDSELEIIQKNALCEAAIQSIVLPKHLKVIGSLSLYENLYLESIEFDEGSELELIKKFAFFRNSMEKISFPSKLKMIGDYAFNFCQFLKFVDFSNNIKLKSIGKYAFSFTNIESLIIPANVFEIGTDAFSNCPNLKIIEIDRNTKLTRIGIDWFGQSSRVILMAPQSLFSKI